MRLERICDRPKGPSPFVIPTASDLPHLVIPTASDEVLGAHTLPGGKEPHGLRALSPRSSPPNSIERQRGWRCLSLPSCDAKLRKNVHATKRTSACIFCIMYLSFHTCPQSAYLKNNIIIYNILLYYFFTFFCLSCFSCIYLFFTFFVCTFLRTFAAAKSNEEEERV